MSRARGAWTELPATVEWLRLMTGAPRLVAAPRGNGQAVVLVPGYLAPDAVMAPMAVYLRSIGHTARTWGRGTNRGRVQHDVEGTLPLLRSLAAATHRPVALVGWSLGGVVARELARLSPELVDRVVTYGTPVVGGPTWTVAASDYGPEVCARVAAESAERERAQPIAQPITAIYTRSDGVVSWPACIDRTNPRVAHVEVRSTHLGMGIDPDVWRVVAEALAPGTAP